MASFSKLKNGWRAQVKVKGTRRTKVFKNKIQAQDWARQVETELNQTLVTGFIPADGENILNLLTKYEAEQGGEWSASKASAIARLQKDMTLKATELTPMQVRDWALGRKYGLGTTRVDLNILLGAVKYARDAWFMDIQADGIKAAIGSLEKTGAMPKVDERDRRVTPEEEAKLIEHWSSNVVSPDVVAFLIDTPIRSGEMCNLKRPDIEGRIITIIDRKDPEQKHRVDRVPLLGRSVDIMASRMAGDTLRPFPYSQKQVYYAVTCAAEKAGLEDLHVHDLRHEGISRLFDAGWQIPQVAFVSGHKNWNTLKRYTHIRAEDLLAL
ncbi:site-specific integrase [Primorskyibacter sp. S87]|uniref:site-specific integrase n=1 Tax=Primorskyibacter sp. S87 TaxID=3415126 RepID=UPI003C79774B